MRAVKRPHVLRVLVCVVTLAAGMLSLARAAPTSAPASEIRTWYHELADPDPQVREQARMHLMGIPRQQLPQLEKVVAENVPVHPAQAAVLYDIVTHVYMAGEPYDVNDAAGAFLGMRWDPGEQDFWPDPPGVLVNERIPGFCAYRAFRTGDIIIGIVEMPDVQFTSRSHFTNALAPIRPGTRLTFIVLRDGKVQKIPVTLDARPAAAERLQPPEMMTHLENDRETKADAYWKRAFAPLVEREGVTSSRP